MKNTIFKQILIPIVAILVILSCLIVGTVARVFSSSYRTEIETQNLNTASYIAEAVSLFLDGAYNLTEEFTNNPDIQSMKTQLQNPHLASVVSKNPYLELIYIQDLTGAQTGRSGGKLGNRKDRWWFKQMVADPRPFVSKSYYSVATNMPCASIFFPQQDVSGNLVGITGVDLKLDYMLSLVDKYTDKKSSRYSFIVDGEGVVVAHPDRRYIEELYNFKTMTRTVSDKNSDGSVKKDAAGQVLTKEVALDVDPTFKNAVDNLLAGNSGSAKTTVDGGTKAFIAYTPIKLKGNSASWGVITVQKRSAAFALRDKLLLSTIISGLAALCVSIFVITFVVRRITNPIRGMVPVIQNLAEGNFSQKITLKRSCSEVNDVMTSLSTFSDVMHEALLSMKNSKDMLFSAGQELKKGVVETDGAISQILDNINSVDSNLRSQDDSVAQTVSVVNQILGNINSLESLVEKQVDVMHQASTAVEQMIGNISGVNSSVDKMADSFAILAENAQSGATTQTALHGRPSGSCSGSRPPKRRGRTSSSRAPARAAGSIPN